MTRKIKFYKCEVCGNVSALIDDGGGIMVCCNQPMNLLVPNSTDANPLTHKPEIKDNFIKVGQTAHPMTQVHHIEWIAVEGKDELWLKFNELDKEINIKNKVEDYKDIYTYCNIHSLWKKD